MIVDSIKLFRHFFLVSAVCLCNLNADAQESYSLREPDRKYKEAVELYQKEKYGAAYKIFDEILERNSFGMPSVKADAYYFRAASATELQYDNAEGLLKDFVRTFPESPLVTNAHFQLGRVYFRTKKWKEAEKSLEQVAPNSLSRNEWYEYHYKMGYVYFETRKLDKALTYFSKIKDANNIYRVPATYYYGHIQYTKKNWNEAIKAFKSIENEKAFKGVIPYYIAQIYYLQGKYEDVISYAKPIADTVQGKNSVNVYRILAESYYNTNQFNQSLNYYDKVVTSSDLDRMGNYRYGTALYKSDRYAEAADRLKRTVTEDDSISQNAYNLIANSAYKLGDKHKAADAFKMVYKLNFNKELAEEGLFNFAKLSYETDYDPYNEAIKALHEYLDAYPNSKKADEAYTFLVDVYMTNKNYKLAIESIDKIKKKDKKLVQARQRVTFLYGVQFFEEANYGEAIKYFNQATINDGNPVIKAQAVYWTAESYYRMNKIADAEEGFNEFLQTNGAATSGLLHDAYYNLGYIKFKNKKYNEAGVEFRKFIDNKGDKDPVLVADAYNRAGDCYYASSDFSKAMTYYSKAYEMKKADPDYALLQQATIMGIQNKHGDKFKTLTKLREEYPKSVYLSEATYELGIAQQGLGKKEEALTYFKEVISKYSNGPFAKLAYLKIGLHYYNLDQYDYALAYYKPVLEKFPGTPEAAEAEKYLKFMYIDQGKLEEFTDLMRSVNGVSYNEASLDSVAFRAGENKFLLNDFNGALANLNQYINKFPNGIFIKNAHYFRAESYIALKRDKEALPDYEYLVQNSPNNFADEAALRVSDIAFANKDWEKTREYSYIVEKNATTQVMRQTSMERILLAEYELKNFDAAAVYAEKVYESEKSSKEVKEYAALLKARSEMERNNLAEAEIWWKILQSKNNANGAEAKVRIYEAMYARAEYAKLEKRILSDVNSLSSYGYWMGKSFIILGKVYAKLDNFDQSKATLQSVIDNAEDREIIDEARFELEEVKNLELNKNQPVNNDFQFDLNGN